uniref:Uncharacterized protein n=1 Tax=Arundo donax TaxID=35708 RepID=A0A0A9GPN0_ARUDO
MYSGGSSGSDGSSRMYSSGELVARRRDVMATAGPSGEEAAAGPSGEGLVVRRR